MLPALVLAAAIAAADVPNPTPQGWVTDLAGVLTPAAEEQLNARIFDLRDRLGCEIAVVTVDDVDAASPHAFGLELFNRWGIGDRQRNDGLLVLLVVGRRRLEMLTGTGMERHLPDAWLQEMQERVMVPRFKAGDLGGGLEAGMLEVDRQLTAALPSRTPGAPPAAMPLAGHGAPGAAAAVDATPAPAPARELTAGDWATCSGVSLALLSALGLSGLGLRKLVKSRGTCPRCGAQLVRLDELADDAHLSPAEQLEERLGAIDYRVDVCPGCDYTRTAPNAKWFSGYSACSACGRRTLKSTSTTLTYATYDHGGTVQVDERCAHCHRHHTYTRSTPPKTRPSSSSRSSFSGGSSRGGGAGSSW